MHNILLDITRLNTRKRASTPSGIDRVDLRYVEHFDSTHTEYVIGWLGCLFLVRKPQFRRLQQGLKAKWQDGRVEVRLPNLLALAQTHPLELAVVTLRNLLPRGFRLKQKYSRGFRQFLRNARDSWLYINTSHVQIRSIDALRDLQHHADIRSLYFIHDLIPITHREYVRPGGAEQHRQRLELLADTRAHVICNSRNTRDEWQKWLAQYGGACGETRVIPIGVEPKFLDASLRQAQGERKQSVMEKNVRPEPMEGLPGKTARPIPEPYFLMLGTIEPRKNHLLVLNVWRRMVEDGKTDIPQLVIIGKRGWENENIVDMLERCDAIQPYVIEKSNVTDDELVPWLQHCEAMIYPSFVEGWGMPVAEALSMGVPVICSDIPPFREVGQGLARYIDPLNAIDLLTAVDDHLNAVNPHKGIAYLPSTWEAHFQEVEQLVLFIFTADQ